MRYLQYNDICIDTNNQLLIKSGVQIPLAPKVYDLLVYFCLNHHRVISKDELMDNVWSGTIVTENAISRTLVKVRKVLDDDPKYPQFIITVPKKGYRMVAEFTAIDDAIQTINNTKETEQLNQHFDNSAISHNHEGNYKATKTNNKSLAIVVGIIFFLVAMIYKAYWYSDNTTALETKQIRPLTREVAEELNPSVSPDLTKLAYTKQHEGKRAYINIENLKSKNKQSISHPRGKLSKPVWSPIEDKIAFLYQHNHVCIIYWSALSDIKNVKSWQAISECGADSSPQFVFSPNGQSFYFNDRQSNTNGYQVFRVDLQTMQKDIVNQPITSGLGNYAFDISPNGERLILLNSEFSPQTRIYTLDIQDSRLTKTVQLPYLMRSVRWAHDNSTIVHPSPHPAYELWQSNLKGENLSILASNTSRVKHVSRINNGKDFSFVSYLLNRDIYYQSRSLIGKTPAVSLDNSSVMDYLPTLANNSDKYAFVSKRSTSAEVYVSNIDTNESQQLTFFKNPVKLYHLAFSPDDNQLAILADNQIFIADTISYEIEKLPLDNIAISGLSWQNKDTLLFSTIKNNDWYFMRYQISTQQLSSLPSGYQGGIYSKVDEHYYAIADKDAQVMKFKNFTEKPEETKLYCSSSFINRKLNLHQSGDSIVCKSSLPEQGLLAYDINTPHQLQNAWFSPLPKSDFDSTGDGIVYTKMSQSVADVMQTSSQ
ncbi:winged helix-turn-helix domain-containing protein [Thalassotalea fonticola]|uniref:Winged helix-turn-helix domain-containing protein n=1 Tax=Thalassotalea fonticola TaxID=3065649 RepID=A0ABZ0GMG4_9GAMM|nr:winged helix-turn-helix domain-containing protein [Colwelliaceae bacterium S1-1]